MDIVVKRNPDVKESRLKTSGRLGEKRVKQDGKYMFLSLLVPIVCKSMYLDGEMISMLSILKIRKICDERLKVCI